MKVVLRFAPGPALERRLAALSAEGLEVAHCPEGGDQDRFFALLRDADRMRRVWAELVAFTREHGLRPVVGHVLPFEQVAEAHALIESRATYGKVVLEVA